MDTGKIAHTAVAAGKIILENGGETYRVEDTILRICEAYGLKQADSFVTPTGIMVSVTDGYGQTISIIKRIKKRSVNLEKIIKVNDLSRNIKSGGYTVDNVMDQLLRIDSLNRYNMETTILFSSIVAAFFTLIFGGNPWDFFASFLVGGTIKFVTIKLDSLNINEFFVNMMGGILAACFAILCFHAGLVASLDKVIIGSIMLLVPGLAITNAIRDTLAGDLVSGITRVIEAFLIAIAIATGTGITLKIWLTFTGGVL
jgi:uncharacterized membrane protein YjjP (DUF1212 family)